MNMETGEKIVLNMCIKKVFEDNDTEFILKNKEQIQEEVEELFDFAMDIHDELDEDKK